MKQHARSAMPSSLRSAFAAAFAAAALVLLGGVSSASAACSNEAFRVGPSAHLADCRAYEQASPTNKFGANIQHDRDLIAASTDGNVVTFGDANGLLTTGGSSRPVIYDARRGPDGWSTNGMRPLGEPGFVQEINGWSADLSTTLNTFNGNSGGGLMVGDTATGTYSTVVSSQASTLTRVSETFVSSFAANDPQRALFESEAVFAPGAISTSDNVYEYNHGSVSLVDRVPVFPATSCNDEAGPACQYPSEGAFGGPYNWSDHGGNLTQYGGARGGYYTPNAFSADGSRVFFTGVGTGRVYVREDNLRTTQVSASQRTVEDPNGHKPAAWVGATPDGSKVFFLSCEKLTNNSTAVSTAANTCIESEEGQDLYEYDVDTEQLTDLTVDSNVSDPLGADVIGFLGSSADGSYVYFVAEGNLAAGAKGGDYNIYLRHAGTTSLVADVTTGKSENEPVVADNWLNKRPNGPSNSRISRVSPDGVVLFAARVKLGSYENENKMEFYRYAPGDAAPLCVTCDPSGAAPLGDASLFSASQTGTAEVKMKLLPHNLTPNGNRIFFQTPDPLAPEDVNAEGGCPRVEGALTCQDVYMWEADGTGSCHSAAENGGCIQMISTGTSADASFFGDASASGDDVFLFTSQPLVPQDQDTLVDAYDARVGGGLASQHPAPPLPPCEGEACRGAGSAAPGANGAGTAVFQGPGNPAPDFKACRKGQVRKKARCVPKARKHKQTKKRNGGQKRGGSK